MSERIVMISGATGGLGTAVVDVFLGTGDVVVSVARSSPSRSEARLHAVQADLTSSKGARDAVEEVLRQFGRIDVLVHVLGGFAGGKRVQDMEDETWHKMLEMNLSAAFYVFREVLRPMAAARHGRIVAVGSRAGVSATAGLSAYSVSKAGLNMLIQTLAAEVKDLGITANAVLPSTIDTPANRQWGKPEDVEKWVKPESIAQMISYLASDAAADVNGALVPIYGRA